MPEKMIRCQLHLSYWALFEKTSKQQNGILTTVRSFVFRVYKIHRIKNKRIKEKSQFLDSSYSPKYFPIWI